MTLNLQLNSKICKVLNVVLFSFKQIKVEIGENALNWISDMFEVVCIKICICDGGDGCN